MCFESNESVGTFFWFYSFALLTDNSCYFNLLDRNIFLCQEKWLLQNNWDILHHVCVMEWNQLD